MQLSFNEFTIDTQRHELRRKGKLVAIEPQVFDLLAYLMANRERAVTHDELFDAIWQGRLVSLSTLTSRINAARAAIGDSGASQILIKTLPRKGYRFTGDVVPMPDVVPPDIPKHSPAGQRIQFCQAMNGVRLAYAQSGEGPPLLKAANWMSHLELDWNGAVWGHWLRALSANNRLTRYDGRGNGLSDRDAPDVSFEAMLSDLEVIADRTQQTPFALLGIGQGAAIAIAYAAKHADRVSRLILYGGYIKGWRARGDLAEMAWRHALGTLIREGWGQDHVAFRQVFTSLFLPGGDPQGMNSYNELQRIAVDPMTALRLHESFGDFDVSKLVSGVKAPTLVMHARGDLICPFSAGRALSMGIPGARFVGLESRNHILLEHERAFAQAISEIGDFLER